MHERLAIVGDGLIGRSVRLAWERAVPGAVVTSLDRGDDLGALATATIVVLSTPIDVIVDLLPRLPALAPTARLVTDTGSAKLSVVEAARRAGVRHFVAGHPMAGGTSSGPSGARATLFDGRTWFLVCGDADDETIERATAFVTTLGAVPARLHEDGAAHDRLVAAISHVPQVVASALLARVGETVGPDGLRFAGAGLRDTTRLAASQPSMWVPILATNAHRIAPLLRDLARELEQAADELSDADAMTRLFERAHRFTFDP